MPPDKAPRWYEFEQVEVLRRPFFVRAATLAEARQKVRSGIASHEGVPDLGGNPDSIKVQGRGRVADQEFAQLAAEERGFDA